MPQQAFPYERLRTENAARSRNEPEFELLDTGIFDADEYFDILVEYAKAAPDDVLIRISATNRAAQAAELQLLPTLWFRNTWSWGDDRAGVAARRRGFRARSAGLLAEHETLGRYELSADTDRVAGCMLFTDNETNAAAAFRRRQSAALREGRFSRGDRQGQQRRRSTRPAGHQGRAALPPCRSRRRNGHAATAAQRRWAGCDLDETDFDAIFAQRRAEADVFYARRIDAARMTRRSTGWRAVPTPGSSGPSSSTTWSRHGGSPVTRHRSGRRRATSGSMPAGRTCMHGMSCRCRTNGNFPTSARGTPPSSASRSAASTRPSPSGSCSYCCANGTCIATGSCRPMNSPSRM